MPKRLANLIPPAAVVDSNILVSAVLFPRSVPGQALRMVLANWQIVFSTETFLEVARVLNRSKFDRYLDQKARTEALTKLVRPALWVSVDEQVTGCRDTKDNKFLSIALAINAEIILTGDDDLLVLNPFRGVDILNPRDFLARA